MNILTKICIVLMALLSVCVSVVFSRMALVPENYRELYLAQKVLAEQKVVEADNAALAEESADLEILRLKRENSVLRSDLRAEQEARQNDVRFLSATLASKEDIINRLTDEVAKLGDAFNLVEKGRAIVTEQLSDALARIDRLEDEVTGLQNDLAARNEEIEARIATERVLNERLTQVREQYDRLAERVSAGGGAFEEPGTTAAADFRATGTILAVSGNMASINIGSVKGIREGMTLYVYREDDDGFFIAHLEIIDVNDSESTGRIYDTRAGAMPQEGDKVTTSLTR